MKLITYRTNNFDIARTMFCTIAWSGIDVAIEKTRDFRINDYFIDQINSVFRQKGFDFFIKVFDKVTSIFVEAMAYGKTKVFEFILSRKKWKQNEHLSQDFEKVQN